MIDEIDIVVIDEVDKIDEIDIVVIAINLIVEVCRKLYIFDIKFFDVIIFI